MMVMVKKVWKNLTASGNTFHVYFKTFVFVSVFVFECIINYSPPQLIQRFSGLNRETGQYYVLVSQLLTSFSIVFLL